MLNIVIMAGGKGERLYPLSTEQRPKQLLKLFSDKTMIEETVERLSRLVPKKNMYIVANEQLTTKIKKVINGVNFVIEPEPKGTAACIALALSYMNDEDVVIIETADHYYKQAHNYFSILKKSIEATNMNKIVLMGITPTFPHTGYGYIELGKKLNETVYEVASFREKPNMQTAKKYIESKKYLWNSGVFIAKVGVMMNSIHTHLPKVYDAVTKKEGFEKLEKISIDYGVMEKEKNLVVIKADMHWDDIGDWDALKRNLPLKEFIQLQKESGYGTVH